MPYLELLLALKHTSVFCPKVTPPHHTHSTPPVLLYLCQNPAIELLPCPKGPVCSGRITPVPIHPGTHLPPRQPNKLQAMVGQHTLVPSLVLFPSLPGQEEINTPAPSYGDASCCEWRGGEEGPGFHRTLGESSFTCLPVSGAVSAYFLLCLFSYWVPSSAIVWFCCGPIHGGSEWDLEAWMVLLKLVRDLGE